MKLLVKIKPCKIAKQVTIDLTEHGISEEKWDQMSYDEKDQALETILDQFDQPYWVFDNFQKTKS